MADDASPTPKRNRGGRPRFKFDAEMRQRVAHYAEIGTPQETIAKAIGCCVETLVLNCRDELDRNLEIANARVGRTLYEKALDGDTSSLIWWEKTRAGRREIQTHEHSGPGGAPIPLKDMSGYTDEQLDIIDRAAKLFAGALGDGEESTPLAG